MRFTSVTILDRRKTLGLLGAGSLLPLIPLEAAVAAPVFPGASRATLDLYQAGKSIGQQTYEITGSQSSPTVKSRAAFTGKIFGLTVNYDLSTVEIWSGGQLSQLRSQGSLRGKAFSMRADRQGGLLSGVDENGKGFQADPRTFPTTYWMPNFVQQSQAIDTQRGGVLNLRPRALGQGTFAGRSVQGWQMGGDLPIKIYYDASGTWSGMQFGVFGSKFEYRRV